MIKIEQIGLPVEGTSWSYGASHMRQIHIRDAGALCGLYPMPRMGEETIVGIKPDVRFSGFKKRLVVMNVAGAYFLASSDAPVSEWPAVFGVEVIGPMVETHKGKA
jgi:hypothetical protein